MAYLESLAPFGVKRAVLTGLDGLVIEALGRGNPPAEVLAAELASLVRQAGYDPVLFGYTDTSADPRTLPPGSRWLRTYEGIAPGFRAELRLPEADAAKLEDK